MRQAISVPRANLISLGVCLGKFSKTEKFRLHITGLDLMGRYAKNKVSGGISAGVEVRAAADGSRVDLDQAEWRNAVPLREPHCQGALGEDHGGHA